MSKFTLLHESPDHFILHNGKASFHIAKKGLAEPTADKIRSFVEGGKIDRNDIDTEPTEKKYELPPAPEADLDYKPAPTPEPDKTEERKLEMEVRTPAKMSEGGKLDASSRAHISQKNFAGPDRSYPIEDASHARNALARVSQHGSPELKAQVRAKVHAKYPGIEQSKADGGDIEKVSDDLDMYKHGMDVTKDEDVKNYENIKQLSKETGLPKFSDGDEVSSDQAGLWEGIKKAFNTPKPEPTPVDRDAQYDAIRKLNTANMQGGSNYAMGGSISKESQSEAIKRYADGNPATLSKGGHIHNNAGKNQLHFHFYDGAGPQQPSALDNYVGGEPAQGTPLDQYTKMAYGGNPPSDTLDQAAQDSEVEPASTQDYDSLSDSDKLAQTAQDIQAGLDTQNTALPQTSTDNSSNAPQAPIVPKEQQISVVPKASPPTPDQNPDMLSNFDKYSKLELQGIQESADAQKRNYDLTAKAIGQNVIEEGKRIAAFKKERDDITAQNTQLFNAVAGNKIDPNQYWEGHSKILSAIGVLLGGIAGGMNGTNQNQVLSNINNSIQQNIEAQKSSTSNKINLYKLGLERYKDEVSAQEFATLQYNAMAQGTLQKIAAQTGSFQAQATAHQMIGQIGKQQDVLRSELSMRQAAMQSFNQPIQSTGTINQNKLRLGIASGLIPKDEVPLAMKESGEYDQLRTVLSNADETFNIGQKNANWRQAMLPGPTLMQDSKRYNQAVDRFLGNITKDTEGRVTPADVKLMEPSMPSFTDNPETAKEKWEGVKDLIRQKYHFPVLKNHRIIADNDPLSTPSSIRNKTEHTPQ
jgi:hypothetical protein